MKRKILIIPSWYPTLENEVIGSFNREQALLVHDEFDQFVVVFAAKKAGILKFLYYYFSRKFLYFQLPVPPKGIGVTYLQIQFPEFLYSFAPLGRFLEKINYKFMCRYSNMALMRKLNEINWKPDFIHAQSTVDGGIFADYFSYKFNVPYLITEHQVFLLHHFSKFKIRLIRHAITNAKAVLAVSEHQKRQILMSGIPCNPVVIGNLVDDELFNINRKKSDCFTALFSSYPAYIKDNDTFFKAVKILLSQGVTDFKIIISGGDYNDVKLIDKENPMYKLAEHWGVSDYVEIVNWVKREKMPEYYNRSDVYISTSIAETFGVANCEAMMCGTPVISTANGGIDDIISDGSGIKIPLRDESALAKAMLKIKNKEFISTLKK